jgi:hypothetical protein
MAAYTASQALVPSQRPFQAGAVPPQNLPFGAVAGDRLGSKIDPSSNAAIAYVNSMPPELAKITNWLGNGGLRSGFDPDGNAIDNSFLGKLAPILVEAGLAAVAGPELLAAFGGGIFGSAATGAVLGSADAALTGQNIGKGALTGFATGGLGSALGGVGKNIASAAGGGQLGNMISKIATGAMTNATMAAVTGKDIGKAAISGAEGGFISSLAANAAKAAGGGAMGAAAGGAVSGALNSAIRGTPIGTGIGTGILGSELSYGLKQFGSAENLSPLQTQLLNTGVNTALQQAFAPSPKSPIPVSAAKPTPTPVSTATPTPVTHTTAPPTTNLGGTSSPPSSTIDPTLGRALSREDSFGGNK